MKFKYLISILIFFLSLSACVHQNIPAATTNVNLALAYLEREQVPEAKAKLLLAQKQAPYDPYVLDALGYFFELTGDIKAADDYYLRAIDEEDNGATQNNYGTFLCRQGKYRAAIEHFMLAAADKAYLNTATVYENAGICAMKIPDKKLALEYFTKAVIIDPVNCMYSKQQLIKLNNY